MDKKLISELAVAERRAYQNEWRSKNKEKVSRYNKDYWERRAARQIAEKKTVKTDEEKIDNQ